jgi:hypothetical protein
MLSANSKDNFTVEDVKIPDNEMLNKILKSRISTKSKNYAIRNYIGGICSMCDDVPSRKIKYDVGDNSKLVDFLCEPCYEKRKSQLHLRLEKMDFT